MKRLRLLLFTLLIVGTVSAQRRTVEHNPEDNTVKITRVVPKRVDMHDFRVGVGTGSFVVAYTYAGGIAGKNSGTIKSSFNKSDFKYLYTFRVLKPA